MFYGLADLDRRLSELIDMDGGFFFEAGANNGLAQSNTLHFERHRGWRGILVEPHPQRFMDCIINRPTAFVEWGALVPPDWDKEYVDLIYCDLMTMTEGARPAAEQEAHIKEGARIQPGVAPDRFRSRPWTISAILDKHNLNHVDFMSIDLEGFEGSALRGLDMTRHRPTWLLVEETWPQGIAEFLSAHYDIAERPSSRDVLYRLRS